MLPYLRRRINDACQPQASRFLMSFPTMIMLFPPPRSFPLPESKPADLLLLANFINNECSLSNTCYHPTLLHHGKSCLFPYPWLGCLHSPLLLIYIPGSVILICPLYMPQLSCLFLTSLYLFDKTTPMKSNHQLVSTALDPVSLHLTSQF